MYCTLSDLEARLDHDTLLGLSDDDGDGVIDDTILQSVITDAAAEIDTQLGGRYSVPVAPTPPMLRGIAASLAIGHLFRRRREIPSPDHVQQEEHCRTLLRRIANGEMLLPGVAARSRPESNRTVEEKLHRRDTLSNL